MRRIGLFTGAALLAAAVAAPAHAGDFDFTIEGFAASVDADADFINDDKFDNDVSGVMGGAAIGVEYAFGAEGNGLQIGVNYSQTMVGEITSDPIRNGNYLIHYTKVEGFKGFEVTGAWDFGPVAIGVGYTPEFERDVTTYQSCPEDHNAVPFGFCGNVVSGDAREGLRAGSPEDETTDSIRFFARYDVSERFAVVGSWQQAEFDQSIAPLDVVNNAENQAAGNRTAHGPTSFAQDFTLVRVGGQWRF